MSDPASLRQTLDRARRERPAPLPRDFSASVLEKATHRYPVAMVLLSIRPLDLGAMACCAMLAAAAVSMPGSKLEVTVEPPPLAVFGGQMDRSPFVNP